MQVEHTQLIGRKHAVTSTRIGEEKPANIISVKGKNAGYEGITAGLYSGTYFSFSDYVHIHM